MLKAKQFVSILLGRVNFIVFQVFLFKILWSDYFKKKEAELRC